MRGVELATHPFSLLTLQHLSPRETSQASGLSVFARFGSDINVYLNALQTKTDFTVLSRPSIFTTNNRKGFISSGQDVAIPTNSNSFGNGGQSTNIEYRSM